MLEKQGSTTTGTYTLGNSLLRKDGEYPMFDGQGTERTVANSSQTVTGTITYDAFGEEVGHTGSSTDPYTYNGQWGYRNDDDDLLAMVGARYYDVTAGRFISRDTNLSQAPYVYCGGDPVNCVDPSGRNPVEKLAAWIGAIGVVVAWPGGAVGPGTVIAGIGGMLWIAGEIWDQIQPTGPFKIVGDGKYHAPVDPGSSGLQAYYASH